MKRMFCVLFIVAIMAPSLVAPAKATSSTEVSIQVTAQAAHHVMDLLPSDFALTIPGAEYRCSLPWWMIWLCRALEVGQCPSCYTLLS